VGHNSIDGGDCRIWEVAELLGNHFAYERLSVRFREIVGQLAANFGGQSHSLAKSGRTRKQRIDFKLTGELTNTQFLLGTLSQLEVGDAGDKVVVRYTSRGSRGR
jgi:hypothetical protein